MDMKTAAQAAKDYVSDLYGVEAITNIGLEEIELEGATWKITVGFTRPWEQKDGASIILGQTQLRRAFKQLLMDDATGQVASVKDRVLVFAQDYCY